MMTIFKKAKRLLFRLDSLESPSYPLSDPHDIAFEGSLTPSESGVPVTAKTAMAYAPVWRASALLSGDVGKLALVTYSREGKGKSRAPEHPAFQLLRYRANPMMSAFTFKRLLTAHALIHGNGYAFIDRDPGISSSPLGLFPLDPETTSAQPAGRAVIYTTTIDGRQFEFAAGQVLHIMGPSSDGLMGDSVVATARNSLGLGLAQQSYANRFFRNNTTPAMVLEHPLKLSADAKKYLKASMSEFRGVGNSHKALIAEEGLQVKPLAMSNTDAQWVESREFQLKEVANWFGIPPHRLGSEERSSFASLYEENQSYLDSGLDPWLVTWENECWLKLLSSAEQEQDSHLVEFDRRALMRTNLDARFAAYNTAILGGWMSRNEARASESLNEQPGLDDYFIPLNVTTTRQIEEDQAPAVAAEEPPEALAPTAAREALGAALARLERRAHMQAVRKAANPGAYQAWVEAVVEKESIVWGRELDVLCRLAGVTLGNLIESMSEALTSHYSEGLEQPVSQLQSWTNANPLRWDLP